MSKLAALLEGANTKFAGYLKENKIDPARVLVASSAVETLTAEDRKIRYDKRRAKGKEDEAAKAARALKPRSGKPVSEQVLRHAIGGVELSGPQKTRLLRAVVRVAEQKKLSAPGLSNLF